MKGSGFVMVGAVGVGAVVVHLTLENGEKWQFAGVLAPALDVSFSVPIVNAEFGGHSHMAGACGFGFAVLQIPVPLLPAGGLALRFGDTHGEIGHIEIATVGVGIGGGGGFGGWTRVDRFT